MKKIITLLFVSLLVGSIFAAGNFPPLTTGLATTSKLEIQIRVLAIIDRLHVTTSQASNLASAMIELRKNVNSLQKQRLSALVMLRNALLSSNKEKISNATKNLERLSKSYLKSVERFLDYAESTITLKQAISAKEFVTAFLREWKGPLQGFFKDFILRNEFQRSKENMERPFSRAFGQQKPPITPRNPQMGKEPPMQRMQPEMLTRMEMRKEDVLYFIVNSEIYKTIVETLQMKASSK